MGSAEMTDSIWGKISQLNAGEMPLPRLLLLHGSRGTSSLQMISDCQSYQIYSFFLAMAHGAKWQGRYKSETEDLNVGDDQRRDFGRDEKQLCFPPLLRDD